MEEKRSISQPEENKIETNGQELNVSSLKKKFKQLLLVGTREFVHLDYKQQLYSKSDDSETERKKAEVKGYASILTDIMAMYNTPEKYGLPFDSVSGQPLCASFIIFGVDFRESSNVPFKAYPIDHSDQTRGYIDENSLHDQIIHRFTYVVPTTYYEIDLVESDLAELRTHSTEINWIKEGRYGLLEIIHDKTKGPVFATLVTAPRSGKGTKNEMANKLYIRQQAKTLLVVGNSNFEKECYGKFKTNHSKYSNSFDVLIKSIKPSKCFKVLILTAYSSEDQELMTVINDVCQLKWNIVIYTGKEALQEEKFYTNLKNTALPLTKLVSEEMEFHQDQGWKSIYKEIANKESCLFVPFKREATGREKYCLSVLSLMTKIFDNVKLPSQLAVFNLILNPATLDIVVEMSETIQKAWDSVQVSEESEEKFLNSRFMFISHHNTLLNTFEKYVQKDDERYNFVVASFPQLDHFFKSLQQGGAKKNQLTLPASVGKVLISDDDVKLMNSYFQFYTIQACAEWWQLLSTREEKEKSRQEICGKFLTGHPIEPEGLYLDKMGIQTVYIKREKMEEIRKLIRGTLKSLEKDEKVKNIIRLCHEPSAGGTTVGRVVLWDLCDEYPSIILKKCHENMFSDISDRLNVLYEKCHLPICILIDTSVVTNIRYSEVKNFADMISSSRNEIKVVILFVEQMIYETVEKAPFQIILCNKLMDDERLKLDELMQKASKLLEKTPFGTLSLYALCQFGRNYKNLETNLKQVFTHGKATDKVLLLLSAVIHIYSQQPLPFYFVSKVLKQDADEFYNNLDEKLDLLGSARDFLLVEEREDNFQTGIRPVTSFVSEKILQLLFGEPRDYLILFVDEFLQQIETSKICVQAVTAVSRPLFVQRRISIEGKKEMFSLFVSDLEKYTSINATAIKLELIANSIGYKTTEYGQHIRAMYARYIAYKKNDIEKALNIMRDVLVVSDRDQFHCTKSNDSALLTTVANFISIKLERMIKDNCNNSNFFQVATDHFKDATLVLQRAQKSELNCYSFTTEARLCYNFMYLYYAVKCNKVSSKFTKLLSESSAPDELKDAAENAYKKLSDLECLLQKHYMEGYDEIETEEYVAQLKIKLLGLKVDIEKISQDDFVKNCKSDPWLARGVVDFFFRQIKLRRKSPEELRPCFEMLAPQALSSIMHIFQEHLNTGLTRSNYRHTILAMIYIHHKCPPRLRESNLQMAQNFTELWLKSYSDDYRALYYLAIFNLIHAIGVSHETDYSAGLMKGYIKKMNEYYTKCRGLIKDKKPTDNVPPYKRHPSELNFVIGSYNTLQALIPKDSQYSFERANLELDLRIFTGKPKGIETAHILFCDELKCEVVIPKEFKEIFKLYRKEVRQYWFILQTRTNGFYVEHLYTENPSSTTRKRTEGNR